MASPQVPVRAAEPPRYKETEFRTSTGKVWHASIWNLADMAEAQRLGTSVHQQVRECVEIAKAVRKDLPTWVAIQDRLKENPGEADDIDLPQIEEPKDLEKQAIVLWLAVRRWHRRHPDAEEEPSLEEFMDSFAMEDTYAMTREIMLLAYGGHMVEAGSSENGGVKEAPKGSLQSGTETEGMTVGSQTGTRLRPVS